MHIINIAKFVQRMKIADLASRNKYWALQSLLIDLIIHSAWLVSPFFFLVSHNILAWDWKSDWVWKCKCHRHHHLHRHLMVVISAFQLCQIVWKHLKKKFYVKLVQSILQRPQQEIERQVEILIFKHDRFQVGSIDIVFFSSFNFLLNS